MQVPLLPQRLHSVVQYRQSFVLDGWLPSSASTSTPRAIKPKFCSYQTIGQSLLSKSIIMLSRGLRTLLKISACELSGQLNPSEKYQARNGFHCRCIAYDLLDTMQRMTHAARAKVNSIELESSVCNRMVYFYQMNPLRDDIRFNSRP